MKSNPAWPIIFRREIMKSTRKGWEFKKLRNPYPVVDAIVEKNGKIVLIEKDRGPYAGMLGLPGGFIEWGETAEQAVVREAKEETGLRIKAIEILGVYSRPTRDVRGHLMTVVFAARLLGGKLRGRDDVAKARWFHLKKIPWKKFNRTSDHPQIIRDYMKWKKARRRETFWSSKK